MPSVESEARQLRSWLSQSVPPSSLPAFQSAIKAETAFQAVHDLIPALNDRAIWGTPDPVSGATKQPMTFNALREFIAATDLRQFGLKRDDVICTAIPNGPEAAVRF